FVQRRVDGVDGVFIHAFDDVAVMAGNGTIGLEIAEDLPSATHVLVPWGGGGLSCGIACGLASSGSRARVHACEVAPAAPLAASLAAGEPTTVDMQPSFVDGIGSRTVLPSMYERATTLGITSLVAPVADVAAAVRLVLERNRVLAEGAGATPVACALAPGAFSSDDVVVCVVSGGVIGLETVADIISAGGGLVTLPSRLRAARAGSGPVGAGWGSVAAGPVSASEAAIAGVGAGRSASTPPQATAVAAVRPNISRQSTNATTAAPTAIEMVCANDIRVPIAAP